MDGLTSLGVMGKISTGSSTLDVMLCLMLPALLRWVTQKANEILEKKNIWAELLSFFAWQSGNKTVCQRCITHENVSRPWWYSDNGTEGVHNHILQRAVLLYINSLQDVARKFENANLLLHAPPSDIGGRNYPYDSSDDEDAEQDEATRLAAYTVVASPPEGAWVKVVEKPDGSFVEFMRNEESETTGGDENGGSGKSTSKQTIDFHLRSTSHTIDPEILLRDFVADAYKFYIAQMSKENKDCRYFFQPMTQTSSNGDGESSSGSSVKYKRYPLSDSKTFGNGFFHPDKESMLALVDHFTNKTGKFAIAGFPHKLGLLLHGPPGTGKTSLIKALAQYTGRHIISIPLNRIATNQELMDIMFDRQYHVAGQDLPVRLPFSKTIFVMEDVDAACDVVNKRSSSAPICSPKAISSSSPTTSTIGPALPSDEKLADLFKTSESKDKLNLAGLLNVLDGVLDSPERIIIMTTNHPEKLDPALIRPGRINKRVYLGYLKPRQALQMVEHYFGKISTTEAHSIWQTVSEHSFTPATLEMMCGEHDTAKELCVALASEAALHTKKTKETVMQRQALGRAGSAPFDTVACQVACA